MAAWLGAALLLLATQPAHFQAVTSFPPKPATVAAIALSIRSRAIQDSRCYLMNGGAVESFFISEDTPVGSVIGSLSVHGDPDPTHGDIALTVTERGAAVGIAPGSRNLTLLRELDREEKRGPSNVYINVRCERRRTSDPSFIIPVSVRVWDVNDNAPVWVGAPYRVRLSELTAVGVRVRSEPALAATDADAPGPHSATHYSVLTNEEYFGFPNELESVLALKKPLDYEKFRNLTVLLRAQDQGSPPRHSDAELFVEVLDADDQNPRFSHDHYAVLLSDEVQEGTVLETTPGPISAWDQDVGINAPLAFSTSGDGRPLLGIGRDNGVLTATRELLDAELPVTVVIKATQVDNPDRYALATVSVSRPAGRTRGVRFSLRQYACAPPESARAGAVLTTLHTQAQQNAPLQFYVSDRGFLDKFAINSAGEVILRKPLDYETQDSYFYQVMVTDGVSNDTASLNITVQDVNEWEPRFRHAQYEFLLEDNAEEEGEELLPVGTLQAADGDSADTVTLTMRGPDASLLHLSPTGTLSVRRAALTSLNTSALHALVTARDSGSPPRESSVPVTVHVGAWRTARGAGVAGGAGRGAALAACAAALAVLAMLVCVLATYIYKHKRSKPAPSPPGKPPAPLPDPAPPALLALAPAGSSGSLASVSAGASTILADSTSSLERREEKPVASIGRQSQRFPKSKIAPQPPSLAGPHSSHNGASGPHSAGPLSVALMSDHVSAGGAGRSGVAWPAATIPARVKKLSWDDHQDREKDTSAALHEATNPALQEHMNLTVYF